MYLRKAGTKFLSSRHKSTEPKPQPAPPNSFDKIINDVYNSTSFIPPRPGTINYCTIFPCLAFVHQS